MFTALFLGHLLRREPTRVALEHSVSSVFALLEATVDAGACELQLVAAQDAMLAPGKHFSAETLKTGPGG